MFTLFYCYFSLNKWLESKKESLRINLRFKNHMEEYMNDELVKKIKSNPKYQELVSKRNSFSLKLSIFILAMFYGFVLVIAFNKEVLATRIGDGVMTVAYPIGAAIIVISFITTLIYVKRANGEFEELTDSIKDDVKDLL